VRHAPRFSLNVVRNVVNAGDATKYVSPLAFVAS
jgi:hypothetical protein